MLVRWMATAAATAVAMATVWKHGNNTVKKNFQNKSCCCCCCCFATFIFQYSIRNENFVTCKQCACLRLTLANTKAMHEWRWQCLRLELHKYCNLILAFATHYLVAVFFICDAVLLTKALNSNDEIRALNGVGKETFFILYSFAASCELAHLFTCTTMRSFSILYFSFHSLDDTIARVDLARRRKLEYFCVCSFHRFM